MTRGFRLSSLLRARQAQEDVARGAVSRSRSAHEAAHHAATVSEAALHATSAPPSGTAHAVVAAIAAQRALAAGLAAARQTVLDTGQAHGERLEELAGAAQRRRVVERLAERHVAAAERSALAAEQRADAGELRRLMAAHREVRELVEIGAYVTGTNPDADRATAIWPYITAFLRQGLDERVTADEAWAQLRALINAS